MNSLCPSCRQPVEPSWRYCANCSAQIPPPAETIQKHPEPEPAPVRGAFGGMFLGFVAAPLLLIVGSLLCLTGLGAFLGVPMVIAGILAPLAGSLYGIAGPNTPKNKAV